MHHQLKNPHLQPTEADADASPTARWSFLSRAACEGREGVGPNRGTPDLQAGGGAEARLEELLLRGAEWTR